MISSRNTYSQLLELFHQGEELTYKQAGARVGIDRRHVERIIRSMEANGVPVRSVTVLERRQQLAHEQPDQQEPDSLKGLNSQTLIWYIDEKDREVGVRVILTEEQAFALAVAAEATRATFAPTPIGAPLREAFDRLLAGLETEVASFEPENIAEQWSFSGGSSVMLQPATFIAIARAIRDCRRLKIDYFTASKGRWSHDRSVDPYGLAVRNGAWILIAHCNENTAMREFNLVSISNLQETEEYFLRPGSFRLHSYFGDRFSAVGGDGSYHVRLLVESDRVPYFHRKIYHHTQRIEEPDAGEKNREGQMVVSYRVDGLQEMRSFVQGWGTGVEVLGPPELVEIIRREIEGLAHIYNNKKNV